MSSIEEKISELGSVDLNVRQSEEMVWRNMREVCLSRQMR